MHPNRGGAVMPMAACSSRWWSVSSLVWVNSPSREQIKVDRLHPLIPRNSDRWGDLYRGRGAVAREFGRLKNEWALSPLPVRGLDRLRPHADLTILAKLTCALAKTRSRRNIRIGMATEPPSAPQSAGGCHVVRDTSRPTDLRASSWSCSHSSAWSLSRCSSLGS
jgi:hypothetical protein